MSESVPEKPIEEVPSEEPKEAVTTVDEAEVGLAEAPKVTFRGNTYDLISLGSLITGALLLFTCVTCNMGYYCLPVISLALGAVGLLSARQAVDEKRTKLWSWLGIAAGGIVLLLIALCFILYIGFFAVAIISEKWG
jgi:hypothetical protein